MPSLTRVLAAALSLWAGFRWLGLLVGMRRLRRQRPPLRAEARRACVTRAAATVFVSVAALYAWAQALRLQPQQNFVGLLGAVLTISLVAGVAAAFMQPAPRSPETLDLFRLRRSGAGSRYSRPTR